MFHVAVDTLGPLPLTARGMLYLLIVVDVFTRFCFLRPLPNKEARTIAAALLLIFCEVGFPFILQSDNGTEFANAILEALLTLVRAAHHFSTPYNPRANGLAERWVQASLFGIRKILDGAETDWDLVSPGVQFGLNTKVISIHESAPFSLFFARSFPSFRATALPSTSDDAMIAPALSYDESIEKWLEVVSQMESVVFPAIRERRDASNARMVSRFEASNRLISFPIGSFVMAKDATRSGKLSPLFEGPFKVVKRNRGGAYLLLDHDGVLLNRAYSPSQLVGVPAPPSTDHTETETHIVRAILDHRRKGRGYQYLTAWKGYDDSHNSWEPAAHFLDVSVLSNYWKAKTTV